MYLGGAFTEVLSDSRNYLAAVSLTSQQLTGWNPDLNAQVHVIKRIGSTLYVGGRFTQVNSSSIPIERSRLASFSTINGTISSWHPIIGEPDDVTAADRVYSVEGATGVIIAGGYFSEVNGASQNNIVALDSTTADTIAPAMNTDGDVYALAVSGDTLYVGGSFAQLGGTSRSRVGALQLSTGNVLPWDPQSNNTVRNLLALSNSVVAVGSFTSIGGQPMEGIAFLNSTSGAANIKDVYSSASGFALSRYNSRILAGGSFSSLFRYPFTALGIIENPLTALSLPSAPTGDPIIDSVLTSSNKGSWTGIPPISLHRQWLRCATDLTDCAIFDDLDATQKTLTAEEVGKKILIHVVATDAVGSTSADSAPSATVIDFTPTPTATPSATSTPVIQPTPSPTPVVHECILSAAKKGKVAAKVRELPSRSPVRSLSVSLEYRAKKSNPFRTVTRSLITNSQGTITATVPKKYRKRGYRFRIKGPYCTSSERAYVP